MERYYFVHFQNKKCGGTMQKNTEICTELAIRSDGKKVSILKISGSLLDIPKGTMLALNCGSAPASELFKVIDNNQSLVLEIAKKRPQKKKTALGTEQFFTHVQRVVKIVLLERVTR
jgi:hypothetical protein